MSQNFQTFQEARNRFQADVQIDDQAIFVRILLCFGITVATLAQVEIFKLLRSPGIESKESIPPAHVA